MFLTLFVIAMFAEQPNAIITGIHLLVAKEGTTKALLLLFIPGTLAFCMIAAEFTLLQRTSVVTLSICGIFKEVVTISAAGIIFHDELSAVNVSGLLVTIACIACYNYLKVSKMREDARKRLEKRDDDDDARLFPQPHVNEDSGSEDRRPLMNGDVQNGKGLGSSKKRQDGILDRTLDGSEDVAGSSSQR